MTLTTLLHHHRHTRAGGYPVRREFSIPSLTPRNTTGSSAFADDDERRRSRDTMRPSHAYPFAPKQRAQGRPGARCTRGLMCKDGYSKTHMSIQVQRKQSGLPRAMVLTAYVVLSPATNSSCHRRQRIEGSSKPGRARKTSADLTPATGARTTRFSRTQHAPFVHALADCSRTSLNGKSALRFPSRDDAAASTASRPNVRDDGQRPSLGTGWRRIRRCFGA
jgi:hypothetical protein